jgi:hypothetical protein
MDEHVSAAGSSSYTPQAQWPELYRDVLHHLFTFLTLDEFSLAARTQKRWLAVAGSTKSRGEATCVVDTEQLVFLLTSPLRHHIRYLAFAKAMLGPIGSGFARIVALPQADFLALLPRLHEAMPHVASLQCNLHVDGEITEPQWPPSAISCGMCMSRRSSLGCPTSVS